MKNGSRSRHIFAEGASRDSRPSPFRVCIVPVAGEAPSTQRRIIEKMQLEKGERKKKGEHKKKEKISI